MKELTIDATIESIETVTDFINAELVALNCPLKVQRHLAIAIDELLGNIARYAYSSHAGKATVRFDVAEDGSAVTVTFIDRGKPFDPLHQVSPDVHAPAAARPIGGLGIYLVKKTMDAMEYERRDGQNILTIKKKIL